MTQHNTHHGVFGAFAFVAAIAFVFGVNVARWVVGSVLVLGALFFVYVMLRIAMGTV